MQRLQSPGPRGFPSVSFAIWSSFPQFHSYSWLPDRWWWCLRPGERAEVEKFLPAHSPGTSAFISSNVPASTWSSNIFLLHAVISHRCSHSVSAGSWEVGEQLSTGTMSAAPTQFGGCAPSHLPGSSQSLPLWIYPATQPCSLSPYFRNKNSVFKSLGHKVVQSTKR